MLLTTRDVEIIDFVKKFDVAPMDLISEVFFLTENNTVCERACQHRLKFLVEENHLKRMRNSINEHYIYYVTMPKHLKHSLAIANFYKEFRKNVKVRTVKVQPKLGSITPDALISYVAENGKTDVTCVEIELSHKKIDIDKYVDWQQTEEYKKYVTVMPTITIVTNKKPVMDDRLKIRYMPYQDKEFIYV